jgi:hypothetical protein
MNKELTTQSKHLTLSELEEHLDLLIDAEDTVTPEQEQEYKRDMQQALDSSMQKRDRVASLIIFLMQQADAASQEKDRQAKREKRLRREAERLSSYVLEVIKQKGPDDKGKYKRLEGHTSTLVPKRCPPSICITDQAIVPIKYKTALIKMSGEDWELLVWDQCPECRGTGKDWRYPIDPKIVCKTCEGRGKVFSMLYEYLRKVSWPEDLISKTKIKEDLEQNMLERSKEPLAYPEDWGKIKGAELVTDKLRLEII